MRLNTSSKIEVLRTVYAAMNQVECEYEMAQYFNFTEDLFIKHWVDSEVVGYEIDGKLAGGIFFNEGRIHIGVLHEFHGRWLPLLKPSLEIGFSKFGPEMVAVTNSANKHARKFIEQVGCTLMADDGIAADYRVRQSEMRYRKRG